MHTHANAGPSRLMVAWRIAWTLTTLIAVQFVVCGLSMAPVAAAAYAAAGLLPSDGLPRLIAIGLAIAPSYVLFALCLMVISPLATRACRWHTPDAVEMRLADFSWPLLRWVRYGASIHLVRLAAGSLFRGTPLWTAHLRLAGARAGRRVFVNSLSVSDYNLLEFGDDVVIGGGVHLSGHTVEAGVVKTARVRLHRGVTIGLGSVIEIGAEIGEDAQIGALSFVPKHAILPGHAVYAGAPAVPLPPHHEHQRLNTRNNS